MKAQRKFCFVTICFHSDRQTVPGCIFGNTKLTAPFSSQIAPTLVLGLLSAQSVAKEAHYYCGRSSVQAKEMWRISLAPRNLSIVQGKLTPERARMKFETSRLTHLKSGHRDGAAWYSFFLFKQWFSLSRHFIITLNSTAEADSRSDLTLQKKLNPR